MADRIEREIEEILAKLDEEPPAQEKKPVSILSARTKRSAPAAARPTRPRASILDRINPTSLLYLGAALVVGGLLLSNFWAPLIWASFAGVVIFLGAFVSSFFRSPRPVNRPKGVYWRDRYIEYEPRDDGPLDRLKRKFRRR